jgi:hypothetical protein
VDNTNECRNEIQVIRMKQETEAVPLCTTV